VKDTGIGVAPDKIKTLFNSQFERSEQAQKMTSFGRGIGLYLSSNIIKAHNGKIWVKSQGLDKGSTFCIELPA
jgi:signal transduction histidine kinase